VVTRASSRKQQSASKTSITLHGNDYAASADLAHTKICITRNKNEKKQDTLPPGDVAKLTELVGISKIAKTKYSPATSSCSSDKSIPSVDDAKQKSHTVPKPAGQSKEDLNVKSFENDHHQSISGEKSQANKTIPTSKKEKSFNDDEFHSDSVVQIKKR
jgi:hypothetical protein